MDVVYTAVSQRHEGHARIPLKTGIYGTVRHRWSEPR
jgi:hypothetical protein